jgi:hypothetical protein
VIDQLLSHRAAVSGEEVDRLLDLRWLVHRAEDAEATLRIFCDLRLRMEQRHYLAFFRLRRWLENHLEAAVRICPAAEARLVEVTLNHYCVEAIRRVALCAALGREGILLAPRLQFRFRVAQPAVAAAHA